MDVSLEPGTVLALQLPFFLVLLFMRVGGKTLVQEQIPDFLSFAPGVERLVLGVANPAELFIDARRLGSVAFAHELHHPFTGVNPPAQHLPQVALFGAEDILPLRLVAKKGKGVGHKLPGAFQLAADSRR